MSTTISTSTYAEFNDYKANYYLPQTITTELEVQETAEGPVAVIGGEEIPLMEEAFDMSVVQPGAVARNQALAPYVGKVRIRVGMDNDHVEDDIFMDEAYLLPIAILGYSRSKFLQYTSGGGDNTPICFSSNGLEPSPKMENEPECDVCAKLENVGGKFRMSPVCPQAQWGEGNTKPSCSLTVRVAFLNMADCMPVVMSFRGSGMAAFNKLERESKKVRNIARLRKKSLSRYVIRLKPLNKGTYVVPELSFVEAPEEYADINEYRDVAVYFKNNLFTYRKADTDDSGLEKATKEDTATAITAEEMAEAEAQAESFDI